MERIGRFDRLSALAEKHMRRGVLTNTLITRETYEPDIRRGALTALETEQGLFLLRDRGDRALLSFLMEPGAPLPAPAAVPVMQPVATQPVVTQPVVQPATVPAAY